MSDRKVTVYARFKAKEGKTEEVKQALSSLIAPTRREEGCISYDLHQSHDDPSQFMFYETWESKAAIDNHMQTPHIGAVVSRVDELVEQPYEISTWEKLS
jgi:quinol monooxygenase YgiN